MGKKRNNAAKKKKATKKKQNLSAAFGVSVQKGGTLTRNNGVINKSALADGQNAQPKNNKIGSSNATSSTNANAAMSPTNEQPGTRPSNSNENEEFRRMHASLEERHLALQARQKECQKKKRGRKSQQKKGWGKFAHPSTKVEFASATLNLGPKSTEQLINEAADHVATGMTDIGHSTASNQYVGASADGKSSLAAEAGLNWKMQVSNTSMQPSPEQSNPFAALDEDSDSDNEWSGKKTDATPQFQFQPASFSFQPTPAVTQYNQDDVDPDDL